LLTLSHLTDINSFISLKRIGFQTPRRMNNRFDKDIGLNDNQQIGRLVLRLFDLPQQSTTYRHISVKQLNK
ncbi:hypothetical protein LXA55_18205, partial [Erwinia amylovora]